MRQWSRETSAAASLYLRSPQQSLRCLRYALSVKVIARDARYAIKQPCSGGTMNQRIKTLCVGGLLALALFGVAAAGPLEESRTALESGDYAEVLRLLRPLANQGNATAQAQLGVMYANGQGVPHNDAQALVWFRKAAEQGNAIAQASLGAMYAGGRGVPQDYAQGVAWFRKAPSKETPPRRATSARCTAPAKAYRRTMPKPSRGFGKPLNRGRASRR
jgi:uncharacterized protein